jgi:hypothetical protein
MQHDTERQERQRFIRRLCLYGVLICLAAVDCALGMASADAGLWMAAVSILIVVLATGCEGRARWPNGM